MSIPVALRGDFKASQPRALARKTKDGPQARRLLCESGRGQAVADIGSNALWRLRNASRDGISIGADRDPIPTQIPLFARRNCRR